MSDRDVAKEFVHNNLSGKTSCFGYVYHVYLGLRNYHL